MLRIRHTTRSMHKPSKNMNVKVLKTKADYNKALKRFEALFGRTKPGTKLGDEYDALALVIEKYEEEHFPMPNSDPIEAIKFMMEHNGLGMKDIEKITQSSKATVSRILNYKLPLSVKMIRRLNRELNIPSDILIQEYEIST